MKATTNPFLSIADLLRSEMDNMSKTLEGFRQANEGTRLVEEWHEDLLHHLAAEVGLNVKRILELLPQAEHNLPTLAYLVRNLFELNIWIEYCCKSEANARRFYEDRWKDGVGLQKAMTNLVAAVPDAPNPSEIQSALASFKKTLEQTAATAGISSLDDDYTRVVEAADHLGYRAVFVAINTFLSKFAHPTAMLVLASIENKAFDQLFGFFLAFGVALAQSGWGTLRKHIGAIGPRAQQGRAQP